jgi:hypothetical protein
MQVWLDLQNMGATILQTMIFDLHPFSNETRISLPVGPQVMNECNLSMISCELLMMIDNRNGNITILEILCKLCFAFVNYYAFLEKG